MVALSSKLLFTAPLLVMSRSHTSLCVLPVLPSHLPLWHRYSRVTALVVKRTVTKAASIVMVAMAAPWVGYRQPDCVPSSPVEGVSMSGPADGVADGAAEGVAEGVVVAGGSEERVVVAGGSEERVVVAGCVVVAGGVVVVAGCVVVAGGSEERVVVAGGVVVVAGGSVEVASCVVEEEMVAGLGPE